MNQAEVTKLMSKLRFAIKPTHRRLSNPDGPEGRLNKIRKTVTALIKYERIELKYPRCDESRGYAERVSEENFIEISIHIQRVFLLFISIALQLISDAIRHGDTHAPTMEMADYWILEKQYVHKLFKVLVPRLQNCPVSYTRMYRAPKPYPGDNWQRAILELRGHPFPSLTPESVHNRNFIQNVLLDEAKKEYRREKYARIAEQLAPLTSESGKNENVDSDATEKTETVPNNNDAPSDEKQDDKRK